MRAVGAPLATLASQLAPLARAWPAAVAGLIAVLAGLALPLLSPLIIALILGAILANTPMALTALITGSAKGAKTLLRLGVVLLGTRLSIEAIAMLGMPGLVVVVVTVVTVFALTSVIGDRLGLDRGLVTLIASGFAICGAAAIAAVESGIRRRDEDVGVALAMVTLFGSLMIMAIPAAGTALGLAPELIGVWAGASIHEVAQVVAAASLVGTTAVAAATAIKLGRVALLAFAVGAARWRERRGRGAAEHEGAGGVDEGTSARGAAVPLVPWFLIGFIIAAVIGGMGVIPQGAMPWVNHAGTLLLAAGMFGLGLGIRIRNLFPMPWQVVLLSAISTAIAALIPLGLLIALW